MGSTIITRTISAVQENAVSMNSSTWGRTIDIPGGWNSIRIGLRWHMTGGGGGNLLGGPRFAFGLTHGTAQLIGDTNTANFIGGYFGSTEWDDLATAFIGPVGDIGISSATKVGTTLTLVSHGTTQHCVIGSKAASNAADRTCYFVEITKGSPNFSVSHFINPSDSNPPVDVSSATFLTQMQKAPGLLVLPGYNYTGPDSLAFSESNGILDTLTAWWNQVAANLEICDIALAVMS